MIAPYTPPADAPDGPMLILGIESSCDETAAAVVADGTDVRSSVVASQDSLHSPYRGVVPEIAARAHLSALIPVLDEALSQAGVSRRELDALAVVHTPGLIGALLIGLTAAKTLAWVFHKPLVGINHLHAHIYASALGTSRRVFPCVSLVVSGGHTSLYFSRDELNHELMGATQDDAAGEAFDKVAALLGVGYPGGPAIDRLARRGDPNAIAFPRPRLDRDRLDFSFSGLKTAVLYHCRGQKARRPRALIDGEKADVAAGFQEAVVDVLVEKAMRAVAQRRAARLLVGGGVARNSRLRHRLAQAAGDTGVELLLPEPRYCVDNAAMVAGLGYHALRRGQRADLDLDAVPRPPESRAAYRRRERP